MLITMLGKEATTTTPDHWHELGAPSVPGQMHGTSGGLQRRLPLTATVESDMVGRDTATTPAGPEAGLALGCHSRHASA